MDGMDFVDERRRAKGRGAGVARQIETSKR